MSFEVVLMRPSNLWLKPMCPGLHDATQPSMWLDCRRIGVVPNLAMCDSMPVSIQKEQLRDFLTLCAVHNAISILRQIKTAQMTLKVLSYDTQDIKSETSEVNST